MRLIHPTAPNAYTTSPLDRAGLRREDEAWVQARYDDPASLFVPVWRGKTLARRGETEAEASFLSGESAVRLRAHARVWALLGLLGDRALFALDISGIDDPRPLVPEADAFEDLRALTGVLPDRDASILAHARGLIHWRLRHGFCGVCGARCQPRSAGHMLACTGCGANHFPRTDPAVIMLVTREDQVLLGHSQRFPSRVMYSTLAGFVEPGESLEEAVAREVLEEAGVRVGRVYFHSSQPWPYPASIMLGFYAEALSDVITIDPEELRDARWFTRAELRDPAGHGFELPSRHSIARRLIDDWLGADEASMVGV
ncbi:MAG TPA: NAD(+) diphosphatase [Acetobacteraceae bacterium]|nr:NAD(+) diphosphatase [Acetobacteraceae bacterium]